MSFKIIKQQKCFRIYKTDTRDIGNTCFRSKQAAQSELRKMMKNMNAMKMKKQKIKSMQRGSKVRARTGCGCHQ